MAFEIPEFDPCSPSEFFNKIGEAYANFIETANRLIDELSAEAFGNFLTTMAVLLVLLGLTKAVNLTAMVVASIVGNVTGTLNALIAMAYSMVAGVRIMIRYLAAKMLIIQLTTRIKVGTLLLGDMTDLLQFLLSLQRLRSTLTITPMQNAAEAGVHLDTAAKLVRQNIRPSGKVALGAKQIYSVNSAELRTAIRELDLAINKITGFPPLPLQGSFKDDIDRLNKKYNIPLNQAANSTSFDRFSSPSKAIIAIPDPLAFPKAIKHAIEHFQQNLYISKTNPETGEVSEELNPVIVAQIRDYLQELVTIPGVQDVIKNIIILSFTKKKMTVIGTRLPIKAVVLREFMKKSAMAFSSYAKDKLAGTAAFTKAGINQSPTASSAFNIAQGAANFVEDTINSIEDKIEEVSEFLNLGTPEDRAYPSKSNLASASTLVNLAELSILSLPSWENVITNRGEFFASIFLPKAYRLIDDSKKSLVSLKETDKKIDKAKQVLGMQAKISSAQALISASLTNDLQFRFPGQEATTTLNADQIDASFQNSLNIWNDLEQAIFDRKAKILSNGNVQALPSEMSLIQDLADEQLTDLALGNLSILAYSSRARVIKGLQAVIILVRRMTERDQLELALAQSFVTSVETNPLFNGVIKPAWDAFMRSLGNADLAKDVYDDLQNGTLASLAAAQGTVLYGMQELQNLSICGDKLFDVDSALLFEALGGSNDKTKKFVTRAKRKLGELKDQKTKMELVIEETNQKMADKIEAGKVKAANAKKAAQDKIDEANKKAEEAKKQLEEARIEAEVKALNAVNAPWLNQEDEFRGGEF